MKRLTDTYTLYNGVKIPCLGFGTWLAASGEEAERSVRAAIESGYRHIDTATAYGNEESVGKAIRESGIARDELFVTTKLRNPQHGYESTLAAFNDSIKWLGLDYIDLYLIHWPVPGDFHDCWEEKNAETWKAFEKLYKEGYVRSIGVSNFFPHHLDKLYKTANVGPMVNQIKLGPGLTQPETVRYCRGREMLIEAYSPMGHGSIFSSEEMKKIAEKYNRSIAQICLRYSLQMGYLPLAKSVNPDRIASNAKVFDFELSDEDVKLISETKGEWSTMRDPDFITF